MESNEQIRYELCDQKDLEVLNIMDDNHNLLRMAYMNNYRNEDEVKIQFNVNIDGCLTKKTGYTSSL